MGKKSKQKGAGFERECCAALSLWVTAGERDDTLWRSAMSGGRATVHRKVGRSIEHVAGDICAVHEDGIPLVRDFFLECKFYAQLNVDGFILEGVGLLPGFWQTAYDEAAHYEKFPMLIWKENRRGTCVGITHCAADYLRLKVDRHALFTVPRLDLVVFSFARMLKRSYPA